MAGTKRSLSELFGSQADINYWSEKFQHGDLNDLMAAFGKFIEALLPKEPGPVAQQELKATSRALKANLGADTDLYNFLSRKFPRRYHCGVTALTWYRSSLQRKTLKKGTDFSTFMKIILSGKMLQIVDDKRKYLRDIAD